ncbi:hypothetical protein M2480_002372 [Parabacteroides sp. PFB2-12]|uniref:BF3164 family lipoprotein n=1 Tax=unclassified Parabacteroides TaxID=2649774 RepID=UPI002476E54A|nr:MULTISPECIES: BF3164 family lipoprotein [unclassified Parabacteroides]MDH6343642.1 hypothetical protein [Parabacteroides sp. PM6-13]MDH6391377.1 hypothetical protein [Parabacteroides sp. PFB2-12]
MTSITKLHIFLLFMFAASSCKQYNKHNRLIDVIENNKGDVRNGQLVLDEDLCQFYDLLIVDSLVFFTSSRGESAFKVYSTTDFNLLYEFGYKNAGPENVNYPMFMRTKYDSDSIWLYDINTRSIINISLNKDKNSYDMKKELMDEDLWPPMSLNKVSENTYFANSLPPFNKGLFFRYNKSSLEKLWIPFLENINGDNEDNMSVLNRNVIYANKNDSLVVCAMKHYNKIFVFDFNGKMLKEIQIGKKTISPALEISEIERFTDKTEVFFTSVVGTNNYFYCLWNNKKANSGKENMENSKIFVFDWNFNHIKTIQTDKIISVIDVHHSDSYLLGIVFDEEEDTKIYRYNIN